MNKKGFFFTVMALILLSFIFISVQLWAQTTSATEQRYANKFGMYSMQNALDLASQKTFENFAEASLIFAVDKFATSLENNPTRGILGTYDTSRKASNDPNFYANDPEGIHYLNKSIYELMVYGNTSGYLTDKYNSWPPKSTFYDYTKVVGMGTEQVRKNLTYDDDQMRYTFDYYFQTTKRAAQIIGYNLSWGEPQKFSFNQSDEWTINVYFEVPLNFSDSLGRLQTQKTLHINSSLDIHGLTDPYLARQYISFEEANKPLNLIVDLYQRQIPHRNVYHVEQYQQREDAEAEKIKYGPEGLGWFFGPAVWDNRISSFSKDNYRFNSSRISSYILITRSADLALKHSGSFGAVILVRPQVSWETIRTITVHQNLPDPPCQYQQLRQRNCLFCLEYYKQLSGVCDPSKFPSDLQYLLENPANIVEETIPDDPNMPYIVVDSVPNMGSGTYSDIGGSWNYHLELPEFLIKNEKNFTEICNTNDNTCKSNDFQRLFQKFGSSESHQIWDMTGPRDMAICGFYVHSQHGPSYLQRFLALKPFDGSTPYSRLGFGIESFNVGAWAGGFLDQSHNPNLASRFDPEVRSRVDYHFYSTFANMPYCAAPFYSAMPGCKDADMCSNNTLAKSVGVGRFAITNDEDNPAYDYNIDELVFDPYDWSSSRYCE